jgi:hypothetical protein
MPADPVSAGRKGGSSRSPKKLAASRRNGFQRVYPRSDEIKAVDVVADAATKHDSEAKPSERDAWDELLAESL